MKSIENQPIIFREQSELSEDCSCNSKSYSQLVDFSDVIYFQLESEPCRDSRLYGYDTFQAGWGENVEDGMVCSTSINDYGNYSVYFNRSFEYNIYKVQFRITEFEEGTLNVSMYGCPTQYITLPGDYTLYFVNPTIVNTNDVVVSFDTNVPGWVGCLAIGNIFVDGIASPNQIKIAVVDALTLEQVEFITPTYRVINNKIIGSIVVQDLQIGEGCYRLALADYCINACSQFGVTNNLFVQLPRVGTYGWSATTGYSASYDFTSNLFCATTGEEGELYLISESELCQGKYYYVSIVVESTSNNLIYAFIGNSFVQFPVGSTGYLTVPIVAGSPDATYGMQLVFFIQNNGVGPGSTCISKVDVQLDDSMIVFDKFSDVLAIGDYSDPCKYFKISGCNAEKQFGFEFRTGDVIGSQFVPSIRLEGRKFQPQYDSDVDAFRYASGRWTAAYADIKKKWRYNFGRLPEYVLDFMSIVFYFDNCYVNDVLHFPASDTFPTITWNDADDYGEFNIELYKKNVKVTKTICSDVQAYCPPRQISPSEEPLIFTQDENPIVSQDGIYLYREN